MIENNSGLILIEKDKVGTDFYNSVYSGLWWLKNNSVNYLAIQRTLSGMFISANSGYCVWQPEKDRFFISRDGKRQSILTLIPDGFWDVKLSRDCIKLRRCDTLYCGVKYYDYMNNAYRGMDLEEDYKRFCQEIEPINNIPADEVYMSFGFSGNEVGRVLDMRGFKVGLESAEADVYKNYVVIHFYGYSDGSIFKAILPLVGKGVAMRKYELRERYENKKDGRYRLLAALDFANMMGFKDMDEVELRKLLYSLGVPISEFELNLNELLTESEYKVFQDYIIKESAKAILDNQGKF